MNSSGRQTSADHYESLLSRALASPIFRRGGIYLFFSFLSQGVMFIAWLLLPWKLSPEEIGQFALLSFIIELLTRLTMMGTDSALLRFYVDPARRPQVLGAAVVLLAAGGALATLIFAMTWNVVPALIGGLGPVYHQFAGLVILVALVSAFANTALVHYIASHDAGRYGLLNTMRSLLLAGGYLIGAWYGLGVRGLLISQLVAAVAVIVYFWSSSAAQAKPLRPEIPSLRELFDYGSPMLFYGFFALVSDYSGRLALESQAALATVGVFQFYNQIAMQINGAWASINRAWTPYIFQQLEKDQTKAYVRIARFSLFGTLGCATGIVAVMLLGFAGLWSHVIPPLYLARLDLFYLLLLGPLFCCVYTAIYPAFYFDKNTRKISLIQSMISLLTVFFTLYLTIQFKAEGAALSWVLGIFITPFIYIIFFPLLRTRLKQSTTILLIWGGTGVLMTFFLLQLHSTAFAMATVLLGAAAVAVFGRSTLAFKPSSTN